MKNIANTQSMLTAEQALLKLLANVPRSPKVESIHAVNALDRVLAEPQISKINVPGFDNSAMDGFALNTENIMQNKIQISQRISAGVDPLPLEQGTAARIFTGAAIPSGANAVVLQEQCVFDESTVQLPAQIHPGKNIRRQGEDISIGTEILKQGTRLKPYHLGLLASLGINNVPVYRRLKVAVLSTGNELVEPGEKLKPGQIYNSNRITLINCVKAIGLQPIDLGIVPDTFDATRDQFLRAAEQADCIVSSGGVSVGEEDYVKQTIETLGQLNLWRVAIKPGKPLAFGMIANKPFIGLPGNPVAALVTFLLFARPFLLKYQGVSEVLPKSYFFPIEFSDDRPTTRQTYLRVRLAVKNENKMVLQQYSNQSSAVLSSVGWADGLAIAPIGKKISQGDYLEYIPFSELLG